MHELERLLDLMRRDRQRSQWSKECTLAARLEHLCKEIEEVRSALDNGDRENLREELGDILLDVFALLAAAEDEGVGHADEFARAAREKMLRRKPWILTDEDVSPEEEVRRWNAVKAHEKGNGGPGRI